ncbi:MAG: hypothetical protein M1821_007578 [Bathelium mastoideum]|nr:MAG: hypothetical protein M1821_007578 [Bathelium mastoideum]KAI9675475.1 MAG: hypothetical protein M1822_008953 [Bathelium mastoideum]
MATIPLGLYLWKRIHEVGIRSIMGLPGDFQLQLLDYIYDVPGLEWMGNANELNAAYAADGYSRAKGTPGCVVTTHGVGELSALNGVAGSHAEQVKVIHVVGQTTRPMQKNRLMIHHSIGFDPDHRIYSKMSEPARCAAAELAEVSDMTEAVQEIDRVIRKCFVQSKPVYIFVPLDMVAEQVPASRLDTKIDLSMPSDARSEEEAVNAVIEALQQATNPTGFVDTLIHRHDARVEAQALLQKLNVPVSSSIMGKGLYDETLPNWIGVYNGTISPAGVKDTMETSDVVVVIGNLPSDTNSGGFTRKIPKERSIEINPQSVVVKGKTFPNIWMKPFLNRLLPAIKNLTISHPPSDPALTNGIHTNDHGALHITQAWIWPRIAAWLRPGDMLLADTGTAAFGFTDTRFPADLSFQTQSYYGSIGWATPAALGAAAARREQQRAREEEKKEKEKENAAGQSSAGATSSSNSSSRGGRTVLVTGDGSFQLTIGEVGTMVARGLAPLIFVINNAGYTIERVIHGAHAGYNDISPYRFAHVLPLFGMDDAQAAANFRCVRTKAEMEAVLEDGAFEGQPGVKVVEVVMEKIDAPRRLVQQVGTRGAEQVKKMEEAGFVQ